MRTANGIDTKHQTNSTWAQRLAVRQHAAAPVPHDDPQARAEAAIDTLWALFEAASVEANAALEAMGEPRRISLTREATQHAYRFIGPDGSTRSITISALLPVVGRRLCGGAYVGTGGSRLSIYLVPSDDRDRMHWQVANTGQAFTSALVHDLFLSVFTDDPEATLRLSPLSGNDIFQDIWS